MAVRFSLTLAAVLLSLGVSRGEWTVRSSETDRSTVPAVEYRRVVLNDKTSSEEATLDLALFSMKSATLRVIDNPGGSDDLANVARRLRAVAGVNGGYFDPQNAPVGLLIGDGKSIAPLRSGVLVVTKARVEILRSAEYNSRKNAIAALQCGPFLVDGGKVVAGLNDTKSARRTFVLTAGSERTAIGFCSPVTLAQLGEILATVEPRAQRALNLDGGSSSAFWFNGERGVFSIPEQKTVRDFVVITPK
jgi:exopolysaccharide biosynthesis protein